ncbi:MAG: hypothetical protein C4560_09065 [Nitrospiraceae bacterium]|nr:MAG: hypothetical protein C4560_09065 [Nitrospiraceae bacterium]
MKKQILLVTYLNEDFDEGLSYAIDLAKAMNEDLTILLAHKNKLLQRVEEIMSAITFAEAGESETAREVLSAGPDSGSRSKLNALIEKCHNAGVAAKVYTVALDAGPAIKDFLSQKNSVDMVLLGPSVTENGNISSGELQKIVRTVSRPIVTMAKQCSAA